MTKDFDKISQGLNPAQKEAVEQFEGSALIIAGAGSGKTRVLTSRIANILAHGYQANSILALTFTNKASREMKSRIASLIGWNEAKYLWMGTFHSVFIRFLREYAGLLGFPQSFTIYDAVDSRSAIRNCIKELGLDDKIYKANEIASKISMAKNNLITAPVYSSNSQLMQKDAAMKRPRTADIFALYTKKCSHSGAMDFDDILLYTNILLRDFPHALENLRNRFSFILVDEFQDTNYAQYLIVKKLSSLHRNLCVVGDDAQSIYAFRGARIENILNFEKDYPEAKKFRLEQNYRSTQTIVNAANSLIRRNNRQLKKECFSASAVGDRIEVMKAYTDHEEAFLLASSIVARIYATKASYSELAVLYRTNAQSRAVEEALRKRSLPYRIYGGLSFYERAEIKDMISYLRLLLNPKDDEAFRRVVNVPARGIGDTTVSRLANAADAGGVSLWEALFTGDIESFGLKPAYIQKLLSFCALISEVRGRVHVSNAYDLTMEIFIKSGYAEYLKGDSSLEGQARLENIEELFNSVKKFVEEKENDSEQYYNGILTASEEVPVASLEEYLENISLMSAIDEADDKEDSNKISLMTIHSAKGLEFSYVYVAGMEENLFPSVNAFGNEEDIEEERRLMYVAMTRAKKNLSLSYAQTRFRWRNTVSYAPSRFLHEIDPKYLNWPEIKSETGVSKLSGIGSASDIPYNRPAVRTFNISKSMPKMHDPDFIADPVSKLRAGQKVEHDRFGYGQLMNIEGDALNLKAIVDFEEGGIKILLLKYAKLRIIE